MSPIIVRCLIFAVLLAISDALSPRVVEPKCKQCNFAYRCNPYYSVELAWALDKNICKVFANDCMRGSYNCNLINNCQPELTESTQEECQEYCPCDCEKCKQEPHYAYVYTLSKDETSTPNERCFNFPSKCDAERWSCQKATPINSLSQGTCPQLQ